MEAFAATVSEVVAAVSALEEQTIACLPSAALSKSGAPCCVEARLCASCALLLEASPAVSAAGVPDVGSCCASLPTGPCRLCVQLLSAPCVTALEAAASCECCDPFMIKNDGKQSTVM